jgi:galactokinase
MDQMASSVGGLVNIDFEDVEEPVIRPVKVDFAGFGHSLCIVDTGADHADLTDDYAAIPEEMGRVAGYFGKGYLKEVDPEKFADYIIELREKCGDRAVLRAIHFFTDNARVSEEVKALETGDIEEFKRLICDSGNSSFKNLQNVYSNRDINEQSVSLALAITGVIVGKNAGYRVHGGGFAGTIQVFLPTEQVDRYKTYIEKYFGKDSCHVLKIRKYGGIKVV